MDLFHQPCGCQDYLSTGLSQFYTTGHRAVSERAGGLLASFLYTVSMLLLSSTHSHSLIYIHSLIPNPAHIFIRLPILIAAERPIHEPVIPTFPCILSVPSWLSILLLLSPQKSTLCAYCMSGIRWAKHFTYIIFKAIL